jgi:hypothetical protein
MWQSPESPCGAPHIRASRLLRLWGRVIAPSITINRIGEVTTAATVDRKTGSAKSETFFGDSPYGN